MTGQEAVSRDEQDFFTDQLDATAREHGDRLAIVHGADRYTWAAVQQESRQIARAMLAAGVRRGDHVGVWLPNHPAWLLLWLAAMRIGAAVVPVNTRYTPGEASYVLAKSQAVVLFVESRFLDVDYVAAFHEISPDWDGGSAELPQLRRVVVLGEPVGPPLTGYADFLAGGDALPPSAVDDAAAQRSIEDTIIVVFTSGTTGFPKGVMHSHRALRMNRAVTAWLELTPEDRVLGHLPLFHVAGVMSSFMLAMVSGGALVQLDQWTAAAALRLIESERISVLSGIPTHFFDLLQHPDRAGTDLGTLRTGWIGGSFIPAEVMRDARDVLGMTALLPVYGLTEAVSCTTLGRPTDSAESLVAGKGVPLGGYEVAIVEPTARQPLPAGEIGEIAIRGYLVMKGYYRDEQATADVLDADGWLYTGDLGRFDEQGYLEITGRLSDKFIVGGNNVHPADVEKVLMAHPAVAQAHVVPRPDPRLGEVAVAFVERTAGSALTEAELVAYCRGSLASFKVPREIRFMQEWPMTSTGKVERVRLRALAAP